MFLPPLTTMLILSRLYRNRILRTSQSCNPNALRSAELQPVSGAVYQGCLGDVAALVCKGVGDSGRGLGIADFSVFLLDRNLNSVYIVLEHVYKHIHTHAQSGHKPVLVVA
jgi:hypothetical protein